MKRWQILAIFVLSGAAGLVYEVVWARQLVLVFGNTTQAVSAILTGFFGGMALGSAVGGRLGDRVRRPLRMYALLELILVAVVLVTPITFRLLHEVYRGVFASLEAQPGWLGLVRFGLSLLALGPATVLMGATLPALTRYLSRDPSQLSVAFGRLYAANTIGAIIGTVTAGFFLIELLGLTGTLICGAICSGMAGLLAFLIDRRQMATPGGIYDSEPVIAVAPAPAIGYDSDSATRPRMKLALVIAFASGLTSLAYQVIWTRLLASGTGNSTYVFTTILMVFLTGIALGAVVFSSIRARIRDTVALLAFCQLAVALFAIIGLAFVIRRPESILFLTTDFRALFRVLLLPVTLVVLPPTFLMGLSFPAASALVADRQGRVATNSGLLLALNTLGAIVGTFIVPFFVIPAVGSPIALGLVAIANVVIGIWLATDAMRRHSRMGLVQALAGVVLLAAIIWSLTVNRIFVDPNARYVRNHGELYGSKEDEIASVQAGYIGKGGDKQIWVTGCSMTLLTADTKLLPIVPLILRPESKSALTIAFGMGSAYRAALIAGLKTEAVELVPSVPKMFPYFYPDAPSIFANPNGRIIVADGRNHVELTNNTYDIIVVDPPPPIESAGVSVISSHEFYAAARNRLTPHGVMMQFMPYGQTVDEFKAQIRTYRDVFPHVVVGVAPCNYGFYLLGSNEPLVLTDANIRAVLSRPGIVEDLSSAYDSPEHTFDGWVARIPSLIWLEENQVTPFVGTGPMITDDKPLPEYFFLRHMLQHRLGKTSPNVAPKLLPELKASVPQAGATN